MLCDEVYITVINQDGVRNLHQVPLNLNIDLADLIREKDDNRRCKLPRSACAGCLISVLSGFDKLPAVSVEEAVLLHKINKTDCSQIRLACRVKIRDYLNGLILKVV